MTRTGPSPCSWRTPTAPKGWALDRKGRLIATTALTISVLHPTKEVLAKYADAGRNHLVVDKKGGIYFTLPSDKPSALDDIAPGGQGDESWRSAGAHGHFQPSPDEKTLYSADSGGEYLVALDVQADGKLANKRNFGKYQDLPTPESHADGIAVDSQGRVYVGIATGVQVFKPKGRTRLGVIPTSQRPQNLAFAGPDKKTLYLTGGSAMFSVKMIAEGYKGQGEVGTRK